MAMKNLVVTAFTLFLLSGSYYSLAQQVALDLDGTNDYVQTNFKSISGTSARTVEAWIKTSANCNPNNGGIQQIITDWGRMVNGQRFTFNVLWNDAIRVEIGGAGVSGTIAVNDGKWHHVAVVHNPSNTSNIRLLVDGVLDTFGTLSFNTDTTIGLRIGRRVDDARHFDGTIDEVKVYNIARTDSAIKADMQKQFCTTKANLVAYYRLNEGIANNTNSGKTTATDYSGNGKNGTLNNFALTGTSSNWVTGPSLLGGNSSSTIDTMVCYQYKGPAGTLFNASGTFYETIPNQKGCDSVITINLTIGRSYGVTTVRGCDSVKFQTGKVWYTSGYQRDTLFNANQLGCDSILSVNVIIDTATYGSDTLAACDSIQLGGMWYSSSQKVVETYSNSNGCDSIHSHYLEVSNSSLTQIPLSVCTGYRLPMGDTVSTAGNYYDTLQRQSGCDSILEYQVSLHGDWTTTVDSTVCDSFISPQKVYYSSGTYQETYKGSLSCDSVVSYQLTVNYSAEIPTPKTACDTFVSESGMKYPKSGKYKEYFSTDKGCDSIVVYDVTINRSESKSFQIDACDSALVAGKWYFSTQEVKNTYPNDVGCDSVVKIDLQVTIIDPGVNQNGKVLTAVYNQGTYQWIDCQTNQAISGATGRSYEATKDGNYKVKISHNNCDKQSDCVSVGNSAIVDLEEGDLIQLYPNPNHGDWTTIIPSHVQVLELKISDEMGRTIFVSQQGKTVPGLSAGVYYLKWTTSRGQQSQKMVVLK